MSFLSCRVFPVSWFLIHQKEVNVSRQWNLEVFGTAARRDLELRSFLTGMSIRQAASLKMFLATLD